MNRASIDLGTNTCLLLVMGAEGRILHDESTVVRLGEGVAIKKELNPQAMTRAKECLIRYAGIAKAHGVSPGEIVAVGTAQARDARNANEFFGSIERETGIRFKVISGEEEARGTFLGATLPGADPKRQVVMDIGGGSTELVAMPEGNASLFGTSVAIGAVKLTELYLKSDPVSDPEFWAAEEAIREVLKPLLPWREALRTRIQGEPDFVCVAGTAVTLAMLQSGETLYRPERIDGTLITRGDAHRLVEELKWRTVEERKQMPGMEIKRADVILAGALIFWRVMEELDFPAARISTRGLRFGILGG